MTNPSLQKATAFRFLLILLLSSGLTWFSVHTSLRKGRLSNTPNYDDVTYFVSATDLIQSIRQEGLRGGVTFLSRDGLHSPYSIGLASLSYLIGGFNDIAPYAANGILVMAYLCCSAYFFRKIDTVSFFLLLWIFMMLPFATLAVVEFRPDPAWAIVTGFAVVFAMTSECFFDHRLTPVVFGILVGIALLIKPSTFAMTIAASSVAFAGRCVVEFVRTNRQRAMRFLAAGIIVSVTVVLLTCPYFIFHGVDTWNYFWDNSYGKNAKVWLSPGSQLNQWLFYISGPGARSNLGGRNIWFVLFVISGLAVRHFKLSSLIGRLRTTILVLILAIVYCINSTAAAKTPFLGGAFYGILIFSAAYWAGELIPFLLNSTTVFQLKSFAKRGNTQVSLFSWSIGLKSLNYFLLIIISVVMTYSYSWPEYSRWFKNERNLAFLSANQALEEYLSTIPVPQSILFTQAGPIVPENVNLQYLRRGIRLVMNSGSFIRSISEFEEIIKTKDMVVTQDRGTLGESDNMPSEPLQDEFVSVLKNDSAFYLAKTISITDGKNVYVFRKK